MSEELKADDARQQAELAQLRVELAAAEARVALAKAQAELAAIQAQTEAAASAPSASPVVTPTPAPPVAAPPVMAAAAPVMAAPNPVTPPPVTASAAAADDVADDGPGYSLRGMFRMSAAFGSSMVVHLVLLIVLGLYMLPQMIKQQIPELMAAVSEPRDEAYIPIPPKFEASQEDVATPSQQTAQQIGQTAIIQSASQQNTQDLQPVVPDATTKLNFDITVQAIGGARMIGVNAPEGDLVGDPLRVVTTNDEALDAITREIRTKLEKGPVLLVWCFDESESMKDDRSEIRQKIGLVYEELGLVGAAKGDALMTAVVGYGAQLHFLTEAPTSNVDKIVEAIDLVPTDKSGQEVQCQALGRTIAHYQPIAAKGRRQMMLVLVTDESGDARDNNNYTEEVIGVARSARCPVYVIGREAVFGYPWAHMNWTVTVPAVGGGTVSRHFVLPMDRGPETPLVECLQTDGFGKRRDAHPSGFGPYEQVRIARETNGIFFMLPTPEARLFHRDDRKFALETMRIYMPDLSSREDYRLERDKHPLRMTVAQVINDLNPWDPERAKHIDMRMGFNADPGKFAQQVRIEQTKARQYIGYLDVAEKALLTSGHYRDTEQPRWQAHYDLMLAQVLAYRVRMYEYMYYLDAFIKTPKPAKAPQPHSVLREWRVASTKRTLTDDETKTAQEESRRRFEAVIKQFPGTPWSARAEDELNRGFGIDLRPHYVDPDPPAGQPQPKNPIPRPII